MGAGVFFALAGAFIVAMALFPTFFEWAFKRHQNQWSWYLRPLFLIPACYFAYRRSLMGIAATAFFLLTSMFWFPEPESVDENVREFLAMEMDYLRSPWDLGKIVFTLLVPSRSARSSLRFGSGAFERGSSFSRSSPSRR